MDLPEHMPPRWLDQIRDLVRELLGQSSAVIRAESRGQLEELRQETQGSFAALHSDTQSSFEALRSESRGQIGDVRRETREYFEATRRHFDVAAEDLRSDVRAIAEGHAMLGDKLDRFQQEVRREFRRVDRRLLRLETRR